MLRSHKNHELNSSHLDQKVQLCGWVNTVRDHGGVIFVDLRDRWGTTQVVFNPELHPAIHETSKTLRSEFCIGVEGVVRQRPEGTVNKKLPTGEIEIEAESLRVYSKSETPPFEIDSEEYLSEEIRLKYRYLDLRRKAMQEALIFRNQIIFEARRYLQEAQFVEVDTPVLTKSTPEGARDYLVPSRVNQGQFFALPQSPQLFKQLLMVSGYDRYFQMAKCFRDEDLRADRQPEFSQLDMEMAFVEEDDIYEVVEGVLKHVFKEVLKRDLKTPFLRLTYDEAMSRYGSDKPDTRFELELKEVSEVFKNTSLKIFKQTVESGGAIIALHVPEPSVTFSRKDFDQLIEYAKECGAGGLAYLKMTDAGADSPIAKFFTEDEFTALKEALGGNVKAGDLVFFAADKRKVARHVLGQVRLKLGEKLKLIDKDAFNWLWVREFPLFFFDDANGRWVSEHHPFTSPNESDLELLGKENDKLRSTSYDLVLNGNEIASGSIRIHSADVQQKIFDIIGLDPEESKSRFGFLLDAFKYGPPPHGGVALGLDRLVAIFLGRESIREVIAFPKTQKAICPMTEAPSDVSPAQLRDLGIRQA